MLSMASVRYGRQRSPMASTSPGLGTWSSWYTAGMVCPSPRSPEGNEPS
jgi:hypothetical protein